MADAPPPPEPAPTPLYAAAPPYQAPAPYPGQPYPGQPYGTGYPPGPYQPPRPPGRHRRLRVAAVVGAVVVVLAVIGAIAAALRSPGPSPRSVGGAIVRAGQLRPSDLRVGDCVRVPSNVASNAVRTIAVVPCSQAHNGQVFTVAQGSGAYPGEPALKDQALSECKDAVPDFLGTDSTPLHVVVFVPEQAAWAAGHRSEQCLLVDRERDITGDIRDDH